MLFYGCFHTHFISYCKAFSQRRSSGKKMSMTEIVAIKSEPSAGGNFSKASILFNCTSRSCGRSPQDVEPTAAKRWSLITGLLTIYISTGIMWCDGDMSDEIKKMMNVRHDRMVCVGCTVEPHTHHSVMLSEYSALPCLVFWQPSALREICETWSRSFKHTDAERDSFNYLHL